MTPLTRADAIGIAYRMSALDMQDALRRYPSLEAWAISRVELPGCAWSHRVEGELVVIGGVVSKDADEGVMWLAGIDGWTRYATHAVKVLRAIIDTKVYKRLTCDVAETRPIAQRFAEWLGFRSTGVGGGFIYYGMEL